MSLKFQETPNFIENITEPKENVAIYVAIGSAVHVLNQDPDGKEYMDQSYNQQYPLFLKKLKITYKDTKIIIILIDPELHKPPYCVTDEFKVKNKNKLGKLWENHSIYENIYYNNSSNIIVISCNENAKYKLDLYKYNDSYEMTNNKENTEICAEDIFEKINNIAIKNNYFLIVNDFSGRPSNYLGDYFDSTLKIKNNNHLNHIIYGLGGRNDGGCYCNLTDNLYNMAYYKDLNNNICAFNPNYGTNMDLKLFLKKYFPDIDNINKNSQISLLNKNIITTQMNCFLNNKKTKLMYNLNTLRRIFMLKTGNNIVLESRELLPLISKYKDNLDKLCNECKYDELFNKVLHYYKIELKEYVDLTEGENISDKIINHIFTEQDPYKWLNILKSYIEK
jgi:hypothetical protein